jgi:hypothetical protein
MTPMMLRDVNLLQSKDQYHPGCDGILQSAGMSTHIGMCNQRVPEVRVLHSRGEQASQHGMIP